MNSYLIILANVDTPGYKRSDISFEDKLKDYLSRTTIPLVTTNAKHINTKVQFMI